MTKKQLFIEFEKWANKFKSANARQYCLDNAKRNFGMLDLSPKDIKYIVTDTDNLVLYTNIGEQIEL